MKTSRNTGTLYVVATPIGNLEDITLRAARILKAVPTVACEDTRRCRVLLRHLDAVPEELISLHDQNEATATRRVITRLADGGDVALVSDAGTPLLSDPGFELVREAHRVGMPVTPIPGPSALTAALSASPLPAASFTFSGFLPARAGPRRKALREMLRRREASVFFEVPHRLAKTIADLEELDAGDRRMTVCRELTKVFETIAHGPVAEVLSRIGAVKGEFVCVLEGTTAPPVSAGEALVELLLTELPPGRAARIAAQATGESRAALYALATHAKVAGRAGQAAAPTGAQAHGGEESPGSTEQGAR